MPDNAIEADNLTRRYGDTTALNDVSLSVEKGEVFSVIGPNGAGKTTLLRCLTGSLHPTSGEAGLLGVRPREADRERIGVLPQEFEPPDRLSPQELVRYYSGLYTESMDPEEALERVGIDSSTNTRYRNLSGGQKRRVCVAVSLINNPDVVFLDEPTTGIDPSGRKSLWNLVKELKQQQRTVFLTTHYMEEAEELADRVGLLSDGALIALDTPTSLVERHGSSPTLRVEIHGSNHTPEELSCSAVDGDTAVFSDIDAEEIHQVLSTLDEKDISYGEVTWRRPNLEDVYLKLERGEVS